MVSAIILLVSAITAAGLIGLLSDMVESSLEKIGHAKIVEKAEMHENALAKLLTEAGIKSKLSLSAMNEHLLSAEKSHAQWAQREGIEVRRYRLKVPSDAGRVYFATR